MGPQRLARLFAGRVHYGWIVVGVMFTVILATVGVRAAPGVLIVPLEQAPALLKAWSENPSGFSKIMVRFD